MLTAYTILGVARDATQEQIAEAFRARCAECHPDRAKDDADRAARTARMSKLTLAKRYLGDPEARAKYDLRLADLERAATRSQEPRGEDEDQGAGGDNETIDALLERLRRGEAGAMVSEFGRSAGLGATPGFERVQAAATKGAEVGKGLADLIGLVRGYQR